MSSIYDLDLNTDVIHEDSTTYQSLLDKNHIDLFSNEHMKEKEYYENQLKEKENEVLNCLFVKQMQTEDSDSTYSAVLFQEPMVIDKQKNYQSSSMKSKEIVVAGTILIMILFAIVMIRYFRHAKRMEETYD